jgi:translation initiation factor IF-2
VTEEGAIQKAVFESLRKRGVPGVVAWHCPNGPDARRKSGYLAGVSDVNAVHRGKFYALELKKAKGGVPSEDQLKFVSDINAAGGYAVVAEGLDEALAILEAWNLIRRAA